jgi:hypothetical protein
MKALLLFAVTAGMALFAASIASAGSVSGLVVDESGAPVAGVHVEIVNRTISAEDLLTYGQSIKAEATTGVDGRYMVDTSALPVIGEYGAHAWQIVINGGREFNIDLVPEDPANFAIDGDVVRNFTDGVVEFSEDLPYGNAGVFVLNNAIGDFTDLGAAEVTLVNEGDGKTYVKTVRASGEGLVATGIPFGTYRASVTLAGRPMQIALWGPGHGDSFGPSVVHDFTMGWAGNQMQVQVKP